MENHKASQQQLLSRGPHVYGAFCKEYAYASVISHMAYVVVGFDRGKRTCGAGVAG